MILNNKNPGSIFGYFGKSNRYPDFIKYNAGGDEIIVLDKWMQDGIVNAQNKLKSSWKEIYKYSPAYNFIYPFTGTKNFLAGYILPSSDKSEREFPFLMFVNENWHTLNNHSYLLPLKFSEILKYFKTLSNNFEKDSFHLHQTEMESILYNSNEEKIEEEFRLFQNSLQNNFWTRITNDDIPEQKFILFNNLVHHLNPLSNKQIPYNFPGIKISFHSTEKCTDLDIAFFIRLINTLINNSIVPAIFWTEKNNQYLLFVFLTKPAPKHLLNLFYNEYEDNIINLNSERDEFAGQTDAKQYYNLLDNDSLTLGELLNQIKRI